MNRKNTISTLCLAILFALFLSACGASSTSSGSGGSSTGGGSSDSETFNVVGELSSVTLSKSAGGFKAESDTETVTDVLAVSPGTGNVTCKIIDVEDDGTFTVPISAGSFWSFFFLNRQRSGSSMFLGWFRANGLDTLITDKSSGTADLGTVTIDTTTETASSDQDNSSIIDDLGLDSETAETVSDLDDVAGRYANPDADNDGELDCDQESNFILDYHVRFNMKINGNNAEVDDIIDSFFDETTTTASYTTTGVYVAYPSSFSSAVTGSVTFVDSDVTTEEGGAISKNTATTDVTENGFGDYLGFGPNISNSSELPSGKVIFAFGDKELTFTNIQTPSLEDLNAPTGRLFPFIRFNKSDSACSSECTLSGLSYQWMKKTASGWSEATLTEVGFLVADNTGNISFRVGGNSGKTIQITIPETSLTGTIDWDPSNVNLSGVSTTEFENLVTSDICHMAISYDDKLGMRYFEGIANSGSDCSS